MNFLLIWRCGGAVVDKLVLRDASLPVDQPQNPLHLFPDISVIFRFLRSVFRLAQLVHLDQLSFVGIDPLLGSDLSFLPILDVNPVF